jgi:diguanylate cyclase (GGDEF)-like protein
MSLIKTVKALVVDDDEDDIYLINDALGEVEGTRYSVTTASSVLAAMTELSKTTFDVIFSDYRLGPVTGINFITSVRAAGIDTPIILLTGVADSVIDDAALKAGSSDFVPKIAITPDVLDRSVRYALAHADRQRLLQTVLRSTISGVAVLDADGKPTLWNPRFIEFAQAAFSDSPTRLDQLVTLTANAKDKDVLVGHLVVECHVSALPDGGSVLALHDVTQRVNELKEREEAEQKIRKIAMQDVLTGLPNRMAFNDYLDGCIAVTESSQEKLALLSFDFNRFKEVNDLFGHAAGDQLLRSVAQRLKPILSPREYVARLGGDEFVVVQTSADETSALDLAQRLTLSLSTPVEWEAKVIEASVSVGIALFPDHGRDRQEILANADLAMYRCKSEIAKPVSLFDASMDQFVRERRKVSHDLRGAIQNNELDLHFQPQFGARSHLLAGFEVLIRWHSYSRGNVSPAEFIPVAEENGMIVEIDEWVLRRACKIMTKYPDVPRFAVNISAKAVCQTGIVSTIRSVLLETGMAASRLELEVTETALIQDLTRALHNLRQIKALGISIALDDFGTGYSSLSLLNSFPFDRIKIDKSFIEVAGNNVRADAIFRTVISLGNALGVPVLVEGVESPAQLEFAVASGCEEIQGFHFGHPITSQELERIAARVTAKTDFGAMQALLNATERKSKRA